MSFNATKASVSAYSFASSSGTYTAITGTTLFTSSTTRWDDGVSSLQTIPFTFTYNGVAFTKLGVSTNGFITMGAVPTSSSIYCGLQASDAYSIAGYGTDLVGGTTGSTPSTIIVGTRGSAPNRQYVIQYTDVAHYTSGSYVDHWTFQIILNETSNTVQVVWGTTTDVTTMGANACADGQTESGNVGLLGASNTDFNLRSVTNGTNTWATSVAGSALSDVCNMSSTNAPASGLTYTWTPAPPVAMSYVSSTTSFLNNTQTIPRSSTNNQLLQIQVITTGSLTPFNITSLALSTSGSTNASSDIANAKVYFTGISGTFATTTQFGSTATNPSGAFTVSGSATLLEGVNYFWVSYDIKSTATFGDVLSGCCTQITGSIGMGNVTPTITCPSGNQIINQVGTWTAVATTAPHTNLGHMLLLSDGSVICKSSGGGSDGDGNIWDKLTPDIHGSYVNGTWSSIAPMVNTRLFFSSQILKDGRVYVAGGEYGTGKSAGEIYNPVTNTWTLTGAPGGVVSDANSEILEDGRVLQALVQGALTATVIYNPATNAYTTGPTARGIHNESAWVKLPDNSILYVDRLTTSSERYIPASNTWIADASLPVNLYDPFGDETGAGFLLPDGRAFFLGSTGHTAYYTPSGTTSAGTWAAGPDIPSAKGTPDAAAAMMVNGKIICAVSPVPTSANHFPTPTTFYEFDYTTNSYSLIYAPTGAASLNIGSYKTNFLDLPDGTVLYAQNQSSTSAQYYIYKPAGTQLSVGKPTINNIIQNTCDIFTITGTLFNGISQGAAYGDDGQMATNYPIIRLSSGGNVYYTKTFNWNSTGVQRGSKADTTQFALPAGLPAGTYSLVVTANGITSDSISFTALPLPTLTSTLTPTNICSGATFTYSPTSTRVNATYTWTRTAVTGISNAAITTPQSSNPNEVLANTSPSPVSVVYAYTINAGSCSNTQNVIVVVKPVSSSTTTLSICPSALPFSWNGLSFTGAGSQTAHLTNSVGCDSAATLNLSILSTSTSTNTLSICSSAFPYTWNGLSFIGAGSQTAHLTNSVGCDSAAILNLSILSNSTSTTTASICSGSNYSFNGTNYSIAGTYTAHLTNSVGCDSAATLVLTIKTNYTITASAGTNGNISPSGVSTVCNGNNLTYTITPSSGYFISNVVVDGASQGSVSTYTFTGVVANHSINATFSSLCVPNGSTINTSICNGSSYLFNGSSYSTTGTYTAHLTNIGGCDSTVTLNLTITNSVTPSISINTASSTVCNGNSVTFTSNANNTGSSPIFQWKKNSVNAGNGTFITFQPGTLATNDVISCTLTANNTCQTTATSNSNAIQLIVNASPVIGTSTNGGTICTIGGTSLVYNSNTNGGGIWSSSNASIATVATVSGATGVVTAVGNGTANLTYTKTVNGCSSFANSTVIVAAIATPNNITGTNTICKGATTQLSTTSTGGVWSSLNAYSTVNNSGLVSGVSAGAAVIRYTISNANGCNVFASYNVTINAIPNVPSIAYAAGTVNPQTGASGAFCANKTFTVVGTPSGGVWSSTGVISVNATSGLVNTGSVAGAASLTYASTINGCSNTKTITATIATCAGSKGMMNDEQGILNNEFTIYPNPAKTFINLKVSWLIGSGSIVVTDLYGKQLRLQTLSMGDNTVDISNLSKGYYFVSIITNEGKTTKKLVIE